MWLNYYKSKNRFSWRFWCLIAQFIDWLRGYRGFELPIASRSISNGLVDEFDYPEDVSYILAERVTEGNYHQIAYIRKMKRIHKCRQCGTTRKNTNNIDRFFTRLTKGYWNEDRTMFVHEYKECNSCIILT